MARPIARSSSAAVSALGWIALPILLPAARIVSPIVMVHLKVDWNECGPALVGDAPVFDLERNAGPRRAAAMRGTAVGWDTDRPRHIGHSVHRERSGK